MTVKAKCPRSGLIPSDHPNDVTELLYNFGPASTYDFKLTDGKTRDWYDQLMRDRTYALVAEKDADDVLTGDYVDKGVDEGGVWVRNEEQRTWNLVPDREGGMPKKENIVWTQDALHLKTAWLQVSTQFVTERRYGGDINGEYDQYDTGIDPFQSMEGTNELYRLEDLRIYTPALQYGDEYTARLSAVNYGDWAVDGVTFTYVLPLGVMPGLDEQERPVVTAAYGGAAGVDAAATVAINDEKVEAKVIQTPTADAGYRASKTAADPVLAEDYYNKSMEQYGEGNIPWVVEITVKSPLTGWWNRKNETMAGVPTDSGYQITVDLQAVVYAQPDSEAYYDRVHLAPYDDGMVRDENGQMEPDQAFYQIYDESYRSADLTRTVINNSQGRPVTNWAEKNNYQQIYGMDRLYYTYGNSMYTYGLNINAVSPWQVYSTSNLRMYPPFTPYYYGRNLFSATYTGQEGGIPEPMTAPVADGQKTWAVSGSQARLLKPVIRHWSEVADPDEKAAGYRIEEEQKLDEFYQSLEKPFEISLFAENQSVMKNIVTGWLYDTASGAETPDVPLHYEGVGADGKPDGERLKFITAFDGRYGTGGDFRYQNIQNGSGDYYDHYSWWDAAPAYDDIGGGYDGDTDAQRAYYPLPVLSNLLPEGIVPLDVDGKPWPVSPEDGDSWTNKALDFDLTVRYVSTLQDGTANTPPADSSVVKASYEGQVEYIPEAGRYMVRLVPTAGYDADHNPLTAPQNHQDMQAVLNAPRLAWNQSVNGQFKVMAVEMPEHEVTASQAKPEDAYADSKSPDTNIMLKRWQQNRSFASSLVDGFKFFTDDRRETDYDQDMLLNNNPFSVGQEYSGYYMEGRTCDWVSGQIYQCSNWHGNEKVYCIYNNDCQIDNPTENRFVHMFNDTRLDTTGPNGRIKDRTLIGDMAQGAEKAGIGVDIEDYSRFNIGKQTDLEIIGNAGNYGLRESRVVDYARLDINGNGKSGSDEDGQAVADRFVGNTMKIYTKNPNIMLDKRVSLSQFDGGQGDNNGSPDYRGRDVHEYLLDSQGNVVFGADGKPVLSGQSCKNADNLEDKDNACQDDYLENDEMIMEKLLTYSYGQRVWYTVNVMNKPVDSPMHRETDSSVPKASDSVAYKSLDLPNERLTKDDGTRQTIGILDQNRKSKPGITKVSQYEEQLEVRRRKLAESGDVAHGAFVFSDYLPWTLAYDRGDETDPGIRIQTYDQDGSEDKLLTVAQARAEGWTIIDNTALPAQGERDNEKFVSITVIPPETASFDAQGSAPGAFTDRESAYANIGNGHHPAGYLESGHKFALKIRTRVSDVPEMNNANNYDKDGISKEAFYNRVFVNLDNLDGDYTGLTDNQNQGIDPSVWYKDGTDQSDPTAGRSWFGDQKRDSISYYSGTTQEKNVSGELVHTDQKVVVKDGEKLPGIVSVKDKDKVEIQLKDRDSWNRKPGTGEDGIKTDEEKERYAYDTAAGFRLVNPKGYAKVTTSRPVEIRGKRQDPSYKSVDPVKMYLAESSIVRGSVGSLYTISDLPLYGVGKDTVMPDLTVDNYKNYNGYKMSVRVEDINTGVWYVPVSDLGGDTPAEQLKYKKLLEEKLSVKVYYTLRSESNDRRVYPQDGFNIGEHYDNDPSKPLIWHRLCDSPDEPGTPITTSKTYQLGTDIWKDINQIMWVVTTEDPFTYPIPKGFRLDVDVDYTEEGKQDLHEKENPDSRTEYGHYPYHQQYFETATPASAKKDDVATNGGLITMYLGVNSTAGQQLKEPTYTANYTHMYANYSDGKFCQMLGDDDRIDPASEKPNVEIYERSGMILTLYKPVGELTMKGRYFDYFLKDENGDDLPDEDQHYGWKDKIELTDKSDLIAYTCTLDNIPNDRLERFADMDEKADVFVDPTIVITVPQLFKIEANNLQYVDYDTAKGDFTNPLNAGYERQNAYGDKEPLYWTFRVVHRDYADDGTYVESGPSKGTDVVLSSYEPLKKGADETTLKFFFKGDLQPGDCIVIDYMVRVKTTDEADPMAKPENKVTYANATDDVGSPIWVKWKQDEEGGQDEEDHITRDEKDRDEDNSTTDRMLTCKSDLISFSTIVRFPRYKAVSTILEPAEVTPTASVAPVAVLQGETYSYRLIMRNSKVYDDSNPENGRRYNPVFYDILPYKDDTMILGRNSGTAYTAENRESQWNPWLDLEPESFKLEALSNADEQGTQGDDGTIVLPPEDYTIWVGPVVVTRDADRNVTGIEAGGLEHIYTLEDRSTILPATNDFYQAMGLSPMGDEVLQKLEGMNKPSDAVMEAADIWKNHVTLEELNAYKAGISRAEYDKLRKSLREIAVTFSHQPVEGKDTFTPYKMYPTTNLNLSYKVETPLNLPIYKESKDISADILKSKVAQYKAGNTFVGSADIEGTKESVSVEVYVNNPADRGEIGDYVWLDTNLNGKKDEVEYAIPHTGTDFSRKLPKRDKVVDENGNVAYEPAWGKDENGDTLPDPGVNGVKVELLNIYGQPSNYNGDAVEPEPTTGKKDQYGRPLYYVLNEDGSHKLDAAHQPVETPYGPLSCVTKSDYYGNQGYYIFPNLKEGSYKLRFTLPEAYNEYGLTTWEIGVEGATSTMTVTKPGEERPDNRGEARTLTFTTEEPILVQTADPDETRVSYDVGIGLPVRYGGVSWIDEQESEEAADHNYDGYFDTVENPDIDHQIASPSEAGFVHYYDQDDAAVEEGLTVIACIAGEELDDTGNIVPAVDMHGRPLITTTRRLEDLREVYNTLKKRDEEAKLEGRTDTELERRKKEYGALHDRYPDKYPELPELQPGQELPDEILEPFVGTYSFPYMYPNKDYVFIIVSPVNPETGNAVYKPTPLVISDKPTDKRYDNDAKYNGWTRAFTARIPEKDGRAQVITDSAGNILQYLDQNTIDFGLISMGSVMITGTVWDDSTDRDTLADGTPSPYDGIRKDGYKGVKDVTVELYAYAWVDEAGWRRLKLDENGELAFVNEDHTAVEDGGEMPVARTHTSDAGDWQFKINPHLEEGSGEDRVSYLVGYRLKVPYMAPGYTLTTMHKELTNPGKLILADIDSDLSGNGWLYQRLNQGTYANLEKDQFDPMDPNALSIYLPYEEAQLDEEGNPEAGVHTVKLGDTYYKYDEGRRSFEHVDTGLTPYAKGTVQGVVWNDLNKKNGKPVYDGIRQNTEPGVKDVRVTLQYRIGDLDYATKSEADYAGETVASDSNAGYDPKVHQIPDGAYVDLFTYDPEQFDPEASAQAAGRNGEFWVSGSYILPGTEAAEAWLLKEAAGDEARREAEREALSQLTAERAGEQNQLAQKESLSGSKKAERAGLEALISNQDELRDQYLTERTRLEARRAQLEVLINMAQKEINEQNQTISGKKRLRSECQTALETAGADISRYTEEQKELKELIRDYNREMSASPGSAATADAEQALSDWLNEKWPEGTGSGSDVMEDALVYQDVIQERIDQNSADQTRLTRQIAELDQEITGLEAGIADKRKQLAEYQSEQTQVAAQSSELNRKLADAVRELGSLQDQLTAVKLEINTLDREISETRTRIQILDEKIEAKKKIVEDVYIGPASVLTEEDGTYRFSGLPLFDENMAVKPDDRGREPFVRPEPYSYRVRVEKQFGISFTHLHVEAPGVRDDNDSDVGIFTSYDYENGEIDRYGHSRSNLGVSDSFTLMEWAEGEVNAYDSVYHLRQDSDVPETAARLRHRVTDAGLLAFENRVLIGDRVWEDADGNGVQDKEEKGVKGASVILYRYDPEAEETYYTYELVNTVPDTATESVPTATPDVAANTLKASGNAWIAGSETDMTAAGTTRIKITGTETRKGVWKPYMDLKGDSLKTTDENGLYQFEVPVTDLTSEDTANQVYRYRVQIYQPDGQETWIWSKIHGGKTENDSDVVPANAFMNLSKAALDEAYESLLDGGVIPEGTELAVEGVYDPSDNANYRLSPVGDVSGMPATGAYRAAVSGEFHIYSGSVSDEPGWVTDLMLAQDDLSRDAGMKEPERAKPDEPDRPSHGGHDSINVPDVVKIIKTIQNGENPEDVPPLFMIPKTGVVPAGLTALAIAAIAGVILLLTRRKKDDTEKQAEE